MASRTATLPLYETSYFEYNKSRDDPNNPDFLGAGGFAEVYKARLVRNSDGCLLDKPQLVAIKVISDPSKPRLGKR